MEILDAPQHTVVNPAGVVYGGFWQRFGATFIDGLIMAPINWGIGYLTSRYYETTILIALTSLLTIAYRPAMEYIYGATVGKMALRLKVVNRNFERCELHEILLRNIFQIVYPLLGLVYTMYNYYNLQHFDSSSISTSSTSSPLNAIQILNIIFLMLFIVEAIVLISNSQKQALHDKIAGTYVVERHSIVSNERSIS